MNLFSVFSSTYVLFTPKVTIYFYVISSILGERRDSMSDKNFKMRASTQYDSKECYIIDNSLFCLSMVLCFI